MKRKDIFLKTYAISLILLSVAGVYPFACLYSLDNRPPDIYMFIVFLVLVAAWYLVTGVGILLRRKWGYYLFKSFIYFLLLSFPIGTLVAYASLKFMKKNHIKDLFTSPMDRPVRTGEEGYSVLVEILALYQFGLVAGRGFAIFHYVAEFGADGRPWITLGVDTVIFGLVSLLFVGAFGFYNRKKAKHVRGEIRGHC